MEDLNTTRVRQHKMVLTDRGICNITGVCDVLSFDVAEEMCIRDSDEAACKPASRIFKIRLGDGNYGHYTAGIQQNDGNVPAKSPSQLECGGAHAACHAGGAGRQGPEAYHAAA